MGNPDSRPNLRDELQTVGFVDGHTEPVGNLMNEFDFTQTPLPPLVLPTHNTDQPAYELQEFGRR